MLISITADVGMVALVSADPGEAYINQHIALARPAEGISREYLAWYLASREGGQAQFHELQRGATKVGLGLDDITSINVPFPPLNEQCRIVAKIDELLAKVHSSQKRLARIPVLLKRFRQSVLAAACSGRLTADWRDEHGSESWPQTTLADIIEDKPKNGYSAKPVTYKTSYRVLTLTATTSGKFDAHHFKYFDEPIAKDSSPWLQPGDILVQRGNTIEYVGVPAVYDGQPNEFVYPDLMIRFRAGPRVETKFLYFALSWERTRNYLRERATGTAGSMPKINQPTLLGLPIDLPSLVEQQEIVHRVESLFALADRIEGRSVKAFAHVNKLTQSILAKAFRGELVRTEAELAQTEGHDFESVDQLLAKIKRDRLSESHAKPRRKNADKPDRTLIASV